MKFILYILALTSIFSCSEPVDPQFEEEQNESIEVESKPLIEVSINEATHHLDSLVENYQLSDKHSFPYDNTFTKPSLLKLRSEAPDTLEYLLTLLMMKKYRYHIECCRQGYEVRSQKNIHSSGLDTIENPVLFEFLRFSKSYDHIGYTIDTLLQKPFEFMNSGVIIMNWLEQSPHYLEREKIREHYDFIKEIEEKGDYW